METSLAVPPLSDLEERLQYALAGFARELGRRPEGLRALLSVPRGRALLGDMAERLGPLEGRRVLEVGSGTGLALALLCAECGADARGIDPGQAGYDGVIAIAHEVLERFGVDRSRLLCATGEALPLASEQYDVVCSFYALEHVEDVQAVLREATRVLRPGGYLYFVLPNFGSVWEGHYGIPWIPHLSRGAAGAYVRLWGRSPEPLGQLNLLTVSRLLSEVAEIPSLRVESLGLAEFERRLRRPSVADLDTARWIMPVLRVLGRPGLSRLAVALIGSLQLWTPLVLVAQRVECGANLDWRVRAPSGPDDLRP